MPRGSVYVGRPTEWGNPFVGDRAAHWFDVWILMSPKATTNHILKLAAGACDTLALVDGMPLDLTAEQIIANLDELRGKDLVCWCHREQSCHADVLLLYANAEVIR